MITESEYDECGTVRPRTLGYQRCWLPSGHEGDCKSQDGQRWDAMPQREEAVAWIAAHPFNQ